MQHEWLEGRLELRRTPEEKEPLIQRLRRVEGQVRGLQQMIDQDRYCLDEMQQIAAIQSALREVALLVVGQHATAGLERAVRDDDATAGVEEIKALLRAALRQS